jgi:hypothetical protein
MTFGTIEADSILMDILMTGKAVRISICEHQGRMTGPAIYSRMLSCQFKICILIMIKFHFISSNLPGGRFMAGRTIISNGISVF